MGEMHHKTLDSAEAGNNVGMSVKGLNKDNMPHKGDVMIIQSDTSLKLCKTWAAQVQTLDIPNEIKVGYSPVGFVRCGHSACKITKINWKMGKETGGKKAEDPFSLKSNEMAEVVSNPLSPSSSTPTNLAMVCPVLLSWMATLPASWVRLSRLRRRKLPKRRAR